MALVDSASILGGSNQSINDWYLGDDREFTGNVAGLLDPADPNLAKAFFTLKLNPNDPDANAILQVAITTGASAHGQITAPAILAFHIFSVDYQSFVNAGTQYNWDFRVITTGGSTITIANGTVAFVQNVTQTNNAGTPAAKPLNGNPQFRGFAFGPPTAGIFNTGDFYRNQIPQSGDPSGWVCVIGGAPGTWRTDGIVGDT